MFYWDCGVLRGDNDDNYSRKDKETHELNTIFKCRVHTLTIGDDLGDQYGTCKTEEGLCQEQELCDPDQGGEGIILCSNKRVGFLFSLFPF